MTNLIYQLYEIGCIQLGEFKLKSGKTSSIYINLRKIISYPKLLREIANAMWHKINSKKFDLICGVPYTALPIATSISLEHNIPMIMRRKEKKDYGTKQSIEGEFKAQQNCLIIEDVITTGSSIIETADEIRQYGLQITDVVVLVDREQGGKAQLEKQFHVHTILSLSEILTTLLKSDLLSESERQHFKNLEQKT